MLVDRWINALIFKCYFLWRADTEQTPFRRMFLSGAHLSAESTGAVWIECLARQCHILMPSVDISRSRPLILMTSIPLNGSDNKSLLKPTSYPHDQHSTEWW